MKVILFGATGMVGQGVLRECLRDPDVERVLAVGRRATGIIDPKLTDLVHADLIDLSPIRDQLRGYDACFFCLGVTSAGKSEAEYRRITYDLTLEAGRTLAELNPDSTFVYVSGQGTDSSASGRSMWARVKGATENALLDLPLRAYMFRPAVIQPMHGIRSRTRLYRAAYVIAAPVFPLLRRMAPHSVTTTEAIGLAMVQVARAGAPTSVLETSGINAVAESSPRHLPST